jgi:hypothetical protein
MEGRIEVPPMSVGKHIGPIVPIVEIDVEVPGLEPDHRRK